MLDRIGNDIAMNYKKFRDIKGNPVFLIGSNYWPAHAGLNMWSDWQPEKIKIELKKMVDLGFNVNRSFLFMPDFISNAKRVEPLMQQRLVEYLDLCDNVGIGVILSFFVGHMSGEDWDVPWRGNRNFYSDPILLEIQEIYVKSIVRACKNSKVLLGWILSNEIPNYEPRGTTADVITWVGKITGWIREYDQNRPISIGDGCWSPEVSRRLKNFELRKLSEYQDFLGIHFYPRSGNPWHQSLTSAFRIRLAQQWGASVIVEEFGQSASMSSEANQAHYYRSILYSSLINDAQGTLNWCFSDFDLPNTRPYSHHPHEMRFGLMKTDGSFRKAAEEMQQFGSVTKSLQSGNWQKLEPPKTGLIIPSSYYYEYPYDWDNDFNDWYPLYLNTFSLMKRSNLNPAIIYEPALELENGGKASHELKLDPAEYPVLFCPRLKRLTAPFWEQLKQYVSEGGILYTSFAHDSWIPDQEEFFQIETNLKFGIPHYGKSNELTVSYAQSDSGKGSLGFCLNLKKGNLEFADCPVLAHSGRKMLQDQNQHPILLEINRGLGKVYFSPYPLEMLALHDRSLENDQLMIEIYRLVAAKTMSDAPFTFDGCDLEVGTWLNRSENLLKLVILNHAWDSRDGQLIIKPDSNLVTKNIHKKFSLSAKSVAVENILLAD
mgnify:CR=1 FL=1